MRAAETDLLEEISIYFSKIAEYYGAEIHNMYTEQDFWRDYPPNDNPFVFPWLKERHERELQKIQNIAREAMRKAAQEAAQAKEAAEKAEKAAEKAAKEAAEKAKMESRMETAKALLSMGMDLSIISKATDLSEEQILSLKEEDAAQQSKVQG